MTRTIIKYLQMMIWYLLMIIGYLSMIIGYLSISYLIVAQLHKFLYSFCTTTNILIWFMLRFEMGFINVLYFKTCKKINFRIQIQKVLECLRLAHQQVNTATYPLNMFTN